MRITFVAWAIATCIWNFKSKKSARSLPIHGNPEPRPNAATSGVPSEVGDGSFQLANANRHNFSDNQPDLDLLPTRCRSGDSKSRRLEKFDGRNAPNACILYVNGIAPADLWRQCELRYADQVILSKCHVPDCREAGFSPTIGNGLRTVCLTHMRLRISPQEAHVEIPVVDLTSNDMPPLSRNSNQKSVRKQSSESNEPLDFAEIDRRMGRMVGDSLPLRPCRFRGAPSQE